MSQPFSTKDLATALENYTEAAADPRLYPIGIISSLSEFIVDNSESLIMYRCATLVSEACPSLSG